MCEQNKIQGISNLITPFFNSMVDEVLVMLVDHDKENDTERLNCSSLFNIKG